MKKIYKSGVIILGVAVFSIIQVMNVKAKKTVEIFFFEDNIPKGFKALGDSNVEVSADHFKDGKKSLKWQYKAGSTLQISRKIEFKPYLEGQVSKARYSFTTWVYNENPISDVMVFRFLSKGQLKSSFTMNMNYKGWRAVVIPFETDMEGTPDVNMDSLSIIPPQKIKQGTLYFDQMALSMLVDPRWPTPDYQVPYLHKGIEKRPNAHWSALLVYDGWRRGFDRISQPVATAEELRAAEAIMARIDQDLLINLKPLTKKENKRLRGGFKKFITQINNKKDIRLKPIMLKRKMEALRHGYLSKEALKYLKNSTVNLQDTGKYMLRLAKAYRLETKKIKKQNLASTYISVVHHLVEQGYMRGSSFGIMHHQGYSIKEWGKSLFLMRDVLGRYQGISKEALSWYIGLGRMMKPKDQIDGFNVDVMNTMLENMLFSVLLEADPNKRVHYLRKLGSWMNYSMLHHRGLAGGIQKDGSFYHHKQHYVAYGNGGLNGLSPVVYYLNGTDFAFNKAAMDVLLKGVMMSRIFSNDLRVPLSLSGRHPNGHADITLKPFYYLSRMETKEGTELLNSSVAPAYLRLLSSSHVSKKDQKLPFAAQLKNSGLAAEAHPEGSWVMNYSSLALHRRKGWLASARGYSRYLVGSEIYRNANHFGRYINYGHLEIIPEKSDNRGFKEAGWDWNHWPGTTVINLPLKELAAHIIQEDAFSGHEQMLLSNESFSGANHLQGDNGMFAMKLHAAPRHNDSFRARKSVFFFDDRIIALGSNIVNDDQKHSTETTLFQDHLDKEYNEIRLKDKALTGLDVALNFKTDEGFYLLDTNQNAYYLPVGQKLKITRKIQNSFENKHKKPTVGNFATAVIDHGTAPKDQGYEYAILVEAGADKAAEFVVKMQDEKTAAYTVLQRDHSAHIVKDRATSIMAYVLFEASNKIKHGVLRSVDRPSMVMIRGTSDELFMSVVDPDLGFFKDGDPNEFDQKGHLAKGSIYSKKWTKKDPKPKKLLLTLKGKWLKNDAEPDYRIISSKNNQTFIEVISRASMPVQMKLKLIP